MNSIVKIVILCLFVVLPNSMSAENWNDILFSYETGDISQANTDYSIAISGVYGFIGNKKNKVVVCKYDGTSWEKVQIIRPRLSRKASFGYTLSVSNDVLVVGAPTEGNGAVYLYKIEPDACREFQKITIDKPMSYFGYSVSIFDDILVVGAPSFCNRTFATAPQFPTTQSTVYVYTFKGGEGKWKIDTTVLSPEHCHGSFGCGVAVLNDFVLVCSQSNQLLQADGSFPSFYLFQKNETQSWVAIADLLTAIK